MKLDFSRWCDLGRIALMKSGKLRGGGFPRLVFLRDKSVRVLMVASLPFLNACDGSELVEDFDDVTVNASAEGIDASAQSQSSRATGSPNGGSASSNCAASTEEELEQALARLVEARQLWQSQSITSYQYSLDIVSDEFPAVDPLTGAIVTVAGNQFQDIVYPEDGNFSFVPAYTVEEWFSFIESRISQYSGNFAYSVGFDEDLGYPRGFWRELPCGYDGDRRYLIQFMSTGNAM